VSRRALDVLAREIAACRRCPRLVAWREQVARDKRRMYAGDDYWGKPVPGFGDADASLVIVGLAPAAHGANRTGRMFTGDRSGDFLYAALHRRGLAAIPTSTHRGDGQALRGVFIVAPCRCAPPANKPTPDELEACRVWFEAELAQLSNARVYLALGKVGYEAAIARAGKKSAPPFAHGASTEIADPRGGPGRATLFASYHVSQQNTFTGKLTPASFDLVLDAAATRAGL
jgi:uracil-DNA glycosylase family 4